MLKIGDKVVIKQDTIKNKYNHLKGKLLTISNIHESGAYILSGVDSYKKWVGIGIDGKYVDIMPIFNEDMIEKVDMITSTYQSESSIAIDSSIRNLFDSKSKIEQPSTKTNRIKRVNGDRETIIEYDVIDKNIKFKVTGDYIHITTLLKILLHETELYNYKYKRISPFKLKRVYQDEQHMFKLDFIDIKDDFKNKHKCLIKTNKTLQVKDEKYNMFIPDFLELCVERKLLVNQEDGFRVNKNLNKAMDYCQYMKSKPSINELIKQGYTVPRGYKSI